MNIVHFFVAFSYLQAVSFLSSHYTVQTSSTKCRLRNFQEPRSVAQSNFCFNGLMSLIKASEARWSNTLVKQFEKKNLGCPAVNARFYPSRCMSPCKECVLHWQYSILLTEREPSIFFVVNLRSNSTENWNPRQKTRLRKWRLLWWGHDSRWIIVIR